MGGLGGFPGAAGGDEGGQGGAPQEPEWPPCTLSGNAFHFSRDAYASIPRSIQNDFTFEAWIKTGAKGIGPYFWQGNAIAWADTSESGVNDFALALVDGALFANIGTPDTGTRGLTDIGTNEWVHLAFTRQQSSGIVQLYVNGRLDATGYGNLLPLDTVPIITLGALPDGRQSIEGLMDEVRLWETVRTEAQILGAMHARPDQQEPGLVAYYTFDDVTDSTLPDLSSKGNHGSVTNVSGVVPSDAPLCEP